MTDQQVYDKVKKHLLGQKRKCLAVEGQGEQCAYRGEGSFRGLKCAIGCLIPATRYSKTLEGYSASYSSVMRAAGLKESQDLLAEDLQTVHDRYPPSRWLARLRDVARRYKLKP